MITRNTLVTLGAAALLTASLTLAQTPAKTTTPSTDTKAPAAAKAPAVTKHVTTGTILSVTGTGTSETVVLKGAKDTDKAITLMFDASTKTTGDIVKGAKVTANYKVDNGQNIATSVAVVTAKPAAATTTAAKAPATTTTTTKTK